MSPISTDHLPLRNEFVLPSNRQVGAAENLVGDEPCVYLCGNSLGVMSNKSKQLVQEELDVWATRAVIGHFSHPHGRKWVSFTDHITPLIAELVGANEKEVVCMSTLTANLHLMMDSFYKPNSERYKILCEAKAFPSDQYAFASQVRAHGLDPAKAIIELSPRQGEFCLREEDILETIEKEGSSIALVLFSGIQYYTGQRFPMQAITRKAKEKGCICGWDLAHAIGNVPVSLHDWDVDFAVWCTYKYVNSGPGGIAGLFIHEKWNGIEHPKFAGWWGHDLATRFAMPPTFTPTEGAQGFQQSNPSVLSMAALLGSLQVFEQAGMMAPIRERSLTLTNTLEKYLLQSKYYIPVQDLTNHQGKRGFTIITPHTPKDRGAQLSLLFLPIGSGLMKEIFDALVSYGVIGDEREPDVIRLAPAPLYSTLEDCEKAAKYLELSFDKVAGSA
ncbi:kynureninase [Moniliophthora roreri MCA 2997]|uniref:Kynureninase n=1 Tax=Moniliophthora roreri (strain MCA 2997) TaxID=1381753 RepID=V2XWC7_MONRO|nr:kynureninase [Moniliophthora roreri MCA 2997]